MKVDPNKVIKVEPKMVKSDYGKIKREVKTPSPMFMGFFYGWTAFYLLYKILEHLK